MAITDLAKYNFALAGGLRLNQFSVEISTPPGLNLDVDKFSTLVAAASIPTMNVGVIEKRKRGRVVKLAGDTSPGGQWTVRLDLNAGKDSALAIKIAQEWQRLARLFKDPSMYKGNGQVQLYDTVTSESPLSAIKSQVIGIWVSNVVEVPLDDESVDEIGTYEITFEYDEVITL